MAPSLQQLPIDDSLPELMETLRQNSSVVLRAPAGAGKTTRVPPAILKTLTDLRGSILILEPRRIAARTAAARMAAESGERPGETVGYRIRFEEKVSPRTRIIAITDGILLRRLQDDAFLEDVSVVIFDEFHERRLESDLALAMVRRIQQTVRPDLRILVMSATLDPGPIAAWLGNAPIVESLGRTYPVHIEYQRRADRRPLPELVLSAADQLIRQTEGDILAFLPGVGEIYRTQSEFQSLAQRHNLLLMPLFGDMTSEDQDAVLAPASSRKVILATNVAETSITIDGITAVIDSGLARQMTFDPDVGLDRLDLRPISRASADQRAGRAGRTQPGRCIRLWDEATHRTRSDFEVPEIHRVDLSSAVLKLLAWGETDVRTFPWYERPEDAAIEHAERLLTLLGAVTDGQVTERGLRLSRFPAAPRIARLMDEAVQRDVTRRAALMAAVLSEREPFLRSDSGPSRSGAPIRTTSSRTSRSDVIDRLQAVEDYLQSGREQTPFGAIHRNGVRTIVKVAQQLEQTCFDLKGDRRTSQEHRRPGDSSSDEALMRCLLAGFPDRVARRRDSTGDKGLMAGGRGVRPGPGSAVTRAPLFVCVELDGAGTDAVVRQASEIQREWLPEDQIRTSEDLFFHPSRREVVARIRTCFADLVLEETPASIQNQALAADVLFRSAAPVLNQVLPEDEALTGFCSRVQCLREWLPDQSIPACGEPELQEVLRELCHGRRSFSELKSAPWLVTLQSRFDYAMRQFIEREAPERLEVPSGSRILLQYEQGRPPVLAVRIQEIFGWTQTPRLACGRIPVLLHLLAPNFRPQQVTDDLASFWKNTYPEVRKDLRRRYPKHAWPDDPLTAKAVRKG